MNMVQRRRQTKTRFQAAAVVEMPSDHQIEAFFSHLENEFEPSPVDAAKFAGIGKKAFDLAISKHPDFRRRLEDWESQRLKTLEEQAFNVARRGDPGMIRFLLQSKMPGVYGNRAKIDLNVSVTSPDDLKNMTDDQLAALKVQLEGG